MRTLSSTPCEKVVGGQRPLGVNRSGDGVVGFSKGVEEGVSLSVDLDAVVGREGVTQELAVIREHGLVAGAEGDEQARGALDVGEHQGDGARGSSAM